MENLKLIDKSIDIFTVHYESTQLTFEINFTLCVSSCPVGANGAPCKHQHLVALEQQKTCPNVVPITPEEKLKYHHIAVGNLNIEPNWYLQIVARKN